MGTALLSFETEPLDLDLARTIGYQGGTFTFHADSNDTQGKFALMEFEGGPGGEPPLHVHHNEDECFYVLEGSIKAFVGGREISVSAGESAFLPRNVPHTFKITSSRVRTLIFVTPGGFEGYFRQMGYALDAEGRHEAPAPADVATMIRTAGLYGITFMP